MPVQNLSVVWINLDKFPRSQTLLIQIATRMVSMMCVQWIVAFFLY